MYPHPGPLPKAEGGVWTQGFGMKSTGNASGTRPRRLSNIAGKTVSSSMRAEGSGTDVNDQFTMS